MTVAQLRRQKSAIADFHGQCSGRDAHATTSRGYEPGSYRHGGEAVLALLFVRVDAAIAAPPGQALPTTVFPGSHPCPGPTDIFASATEGHRTSLWVPRIACRPIPMQVRQRTSASRVVGWAGGILSAASRARITFALRAPGAVRVSGRHGRPVAGWTLINGNRVR